MLKRPPKTTTVLQMEALECGAAALSMVLGYYRRYIPLEQLRVDCGVSRDGSKASNVLRAARFHGLIAKGFKKEIEGLKETRLPAILFWEFNHFVVLDGIKGDKYFINDPASGPRIVTSGDFSKAFTGIVLEFEPGPEFTAGGNKPNIFHAVLERAYRVPGTIGYVVVASISIAALFLALPAFVRSFIDDILIGKLRGYLVPLLSLMLLTALLLGLMQILRDRVTARFSTGMMLSSSSQFFWHVLRLPLLFFSHRYVGDISGRIHSNVQIAKIASAQLFQLIMGSLVVVIFSAVMFRYDWVLTLTSLAAFSLNMVAIRIVAQRQGDVDSKTLVERNRTLSAIITGLHSIEALKANGSEGEFFARFSGHWANMMSARQRYATQSAVMDALPSFLLMLSLIVVFLVGSVRVLEMDLSVGMFVAVAILSVGLLTPMARLSTAAQSLKQLNFEQGRIDDVMHYPIDAEWLKVPIDDNEQPPIRQLSGQVSIHNLSFSYDRYSKPVIENFNLEVNPGGRVAIVGATGSGKSTIAKLICGLYEPLTGEIQFDGVPRPQILREVLARHIGYVEQDITLLAGSIWDNLTLWDTTLAVDDVIAAARDAGIYDEIVNLFDGFEGRIDEGGRNLSGGEMQRLEIARALTQNPSILILDECMSALDPLTEKVIDDHLRRRGCTCIFVAHRLSTIRDCDEIIVLKSGSIVQRGTHEKMIAEDGPYRQLMELSA